MQPAERPSTASRPSLETASADAGRAGRRLTVSDLPPADPVRWVVRRKAEVVAAVRMGLITLDDACKRYALSVEEFLSWQRKLERYGTAGLRARTVREP